MEMRWQQALGRIWGSPQKTTAALAREDQGHAFAVVVAAVLGATLPFRTAVEISADGEPAVQWAALPTLALGGMAAGVVGLFLLGWLFRNFSRMFGGVATIRQARIALGWGLVPLCGLSVLLAVLSVWLLPALATSADPGATAAPLALFLFAWMLYAYVILLLGLSGVTGIGLMKTFLAFCLTLAVSFFPILTLAQWILGTTA